MKMTEIKRIFKFGIVGILNTVIDFIVFNILIYFHLPITAAKAVSYSAGTINSYFFNKYWTFKTKNTKSNSKEFVSFIIVNLITLILSVILMKFISLAVNKIEFIKDYKFIANNLANLIVVAITLVLNFVGSKLFVFKIKE